MKIIEGSLPEGRLWRVLVLFSLEQEPGLAWQLAMQLAQGNSGEMVAGIILPESMAENARGQAQVIFSQARELVQADDKVSSLLVETANYQQALLEIIEAADIDLILADGDRPEWHSLDRMPVPVAVIRGSAYRAYDEDAASDRSPQMKPIESILIPTAGGPNTVLALGFLLPLAPAVKITLLYVAAEHLGENEVAHGSARLRQLAQFADASERVERKVVQAGSATEGIIGEASGPYDLVVLGASRESSFDRALFGDVVRSVVRESKTPVIVVRDATSTVGNLTRNLAWRIQDVIPRLKRSARTEVYVRIRRSARPTTDFFILMGLSSLISALGLLLNSVAVVIGAMLVAPLMSPMIGAGLAIVLGNTRFLRLTLAAIVRGALLAVFLSLLTGLLRANDPLTSEILLRTQPTLIDLGVAIFAGMAGAYALAHSEAAAALPGVAISAALVPPLSAVGISLATRNFAEAFGATLLFTTNLTAIVAAAVFVFVILGFRPTRGQKAERAVQMRSVQVALSVLVLITIILAVTTYRLARESSLRNQIAGATETFANEIPGVEFERLELENFNDPEEPLTLLLTVRATYDVPYQAVDSLRDRIGTAIQPELGPEREVALELTVIRVTKLDPAIPPTATPTPTQTETPTPGPTPTATNTPTPSATATQIPLPVPTVTPTTVITPAGTGTAIATPTDTPVPLPTATTATSATPTITGTLTTPSGTTSTPPTPSATSTATTQSTNPVTLTPTSLPTETTVTPTPDLNPTPSPSAAAQSASDQ